MLELACGPAHSPGFLIMAACTVNGFLFRQAGRLDGRLSVGHGVAIIYWNKDGRKRQYTCPRVQHVASRAACKSSSNRHAKFKMISVLINAEYLSIRFSLLAFNRTESSSARCAACTLVSRAVHQHCLCAFNHGPLMSLGSHGMCIWPGPIGSCLDQASL
jgi:hypothetical protein